MNDKDILYKCLKCNNKEIVKANDYRKDGRRCSKCNGHIVPLGYIGVDWASDNDRIGYTSTPGSKNRKMFEFLENGE